MNDPVWPFQSRPPKPVRLEELGFTEEAIK